MRLARLQDTMSFRIALCLVVLSLGLFAGCDEKRIEKLEEGVSTETQVREQFGDPLTVVPQADGSRILEYTRQPEGTTNYYITLGPDGVMTSLRQVLTPANFAKVALGMGQLDVRAILGRPAKVQRYATKPGETWEWRFQEGNETRIFSAVFDPSGHVTATSIEKDAAREVKQ